ncbi:MAG: hypothetical protein P9X22_03015 [Candidatus Zapsychrus exili]|nr:hypothetical protein [Candidatus Zapsychrus exili]
MKRTYMFLEKTVFILGAGASVPYSYPTGFRLNEEIKSLLANFPESPQHCSKEMLEHFIFFNKLGYKPNDLKNFDEALRDSARYSIDKFLEKRKDCLELGKILIAYVLKKKEFKHLLSIDLDSKNWYAKLFDMLDTSVDNIDKH